MKKFLAALLVALMLLASGSALAYYYDYMYDLDYYYYMPVETNGRGSLVFQRQPRGSFMSSHQFNDGDWIYVHLYYREGNYAIAYEDGDYGYVDVSYIDWDYDPFGDYSDTYYDDDEAYADSYYCGPEYRYSLGLYSYYRVVTKGRGNLVFQSEPRGSFMSSYSYSDGDWILVNPYYREGNYALAYDNGVYGYVDVSYIDW